MTQFNDLFKPENLFTRDNPFLKTAQKAHLQFADSFEKAARVQLCFAEELLQLNRKRIDSLYAGESLVDAISAQQDLATELGKCATTWADELKEVAVELQNGVSDAANDLLSSAANESGSARGKKAKAA